MRFLVLDPPIGILLKELTVEVPTNLPIDYRERKLRDHARWMRSNSHGN